MGGGMAVPPATSAILSAMTMLAFVLHVGSGFVALVSGSIAVCARKGRLLHRRAGNVFFAAMLVMAAFAAYLAVAEPGQIFNVFIATFAGYLVTTAWMTVRRAAGAVGGAERGALVVGLILFAPFGILAFQLAAGLPPMFKTGLPFKGAVLIAIYAFTAVLGIAALGDAKIVLAGGISGAPRIARHLWRMCLGLTMAAGSAFTNGFARFLPGPYHVPLVFFLPQFVPLGLLIFWMIRVRFMGWLERNGTRIGVDA